MNESYRRILQAVKNGDLSVDQALNRLKAQPFTDIGYAKIDMHRRLRQGAAEVIYGAGKTPEQIAGILKAMQKAGQTRALVTRLSAQAEEEVRKYCPLHYYAEAHLGIMGDMPVPDGLGRIIVATGGTSDIPVAEEAALTAEFLGNRVTRLFDVGVAGLHRLLAHLDDLLGASVVIAVAGMEGALASVVGGLVDCPVIAVPTSVGYGASFGGVSALLSMLNSCASGVCAVNIDNGFGAGFLANRINHMKEKTDENPIP